MPVDIGRAGVMLVKGPLMSTVSMQLKNVHHVVKIKNSPGIQLFLFLYGVYLSMCLNVSHVLIMYFF